MSLFQTIIVDVEKFFKTVETDAGKFCAAFVKLFKKSPVAVQVVTNFVDEVAPLIEAGVALADPILEPAVAGALAVTETALAGISASLTAANSGQSLLQNLENFATTVPQLLGDLAIKNPALQSRVTAIVNLIVNESKVIIPAVEAWVKQAANPVSTPAA